jgi:hypothetical protein
MNPNNLPFRPFFCQAGKLGRDDRLYQWRTERLLIM